MDFVPAPGRRGDLKRFSERTKRGNKSSRFFPYKMEITPARKKLLAQRRRREGVYQPSSRSKRDFFRRRRGKEMEWMVPVQGTETKWTLSRRA